MALQKTITRPNSTQGGYIRLRYFNWDDIDRVASGHFYLFATKAARDSQPKEPICLIAKLRLEGDKFDQYLSNAAIAAAKSDHVRQFYVAMKAEQALAGGGLTSIDLSDAADA